MHMVEFYKSSGGWKQKSQQSSKDKNLQEGGEKYRREKYGI